MEKLIKTVFFDAGGTLLHPYPSVGEIYARTAAAHGLNADPAQLEQKFRAAWKKCRSERSRVDKNWWRQVVTAVFESYSFKDFEKFFDAVYDAFAQKESWRVFDDVIPTLEALKTQDVRMAIVSNWDERLPELLQALGLAPYFERQFISFSSGFVKPDPKVFLVALKSMGIHPLEAVHVGDDQQEDVECAQAAGIRAYLIARGQRPINSRMLSKLDEILVRL